MKLENMAKANELANFIRNIDEKIDQLSKFSFSGDKVDDLEIGDGQHFPLTLSAADIGPEKASEVQNELWDALLKTKSDLTAELEKL